MNGGAGWDGVRYEWGKNCSLSIFLFVLFVTKFQQNANKQQRQQTIGKSRKCLNHT